MGVRVSKQPLGALQRAGTGVESRQQQIPFNFFSVSKHLQLAEEMSCSLAIDSHFSGAEISSEDARPDSRVQVEAKIGQLISQFY